MMSIMHLPRSVPLPPRPRLWPAAVFALLACLLLQACGTLPTDVPRPGSAAWPATRCSTGTGR
jgi:hypothetical protein